MKDFYGYMKVILHHLYQLSIRDKSHYDPQVFWAQGLGLVLWRYNQYSFDLFLAWQFVSVITNYKGQYLTKLKKQNKTTIFCQAQFITYWPIRRTYFNKVSDTTECPIEVSKDRTVICKRFTSFNTYAVGLNVYLIESWQSLSFLTCFLLLSGLLQGLGFFTVWHCLPITSACRAFLLHSLKAWCTRNMSIPSKLYSLNCIEKFFKWTNCFMTSVEKMFYQNLIPVIHIWYPMTAPHLWGLDFILQYSSQGQSQGTITQKIMGRRGAQSSHFGEEY